VRAAAFLRLVRTDTPAAATAADLAPASGDATAYLAALRAAPAVGCRLECALEFVPPAERVSADEEDDWLAAAQAAGGLVAAAGIAVTFAAAPPQVPTAPPPLWVDVLALRTLAIAKRFVGC
jgi:hypothetical protein